MAMLHTHNLKCDFYKKLNQCDRTKLKNLIILIFKLFLYFHIQILEAGAKLVQKSVSERVNMHVLNCH